MNKPFRRGMWLAVAAAASLVAAGRIDLLAGYGQGDMARLFTALIVMLPVGAFFVSLPERIRRRKEPRRRSDWKGCVVCFLGGLGLMLGAGIAGGGDGLMLTGLLQGSVSAYVFLGVSWAAGLLAARLMGRRRAP